MTLHKKIGHIAKYKGDRLFCFAEGLNFESVLCGSI